MSLELESTPSGVRFRVKVQARARREEIAGIHAGALRLRVSAPALEGRANQAVVALLAERLQVAKSSIKIARGDRAPLKLIEVVGLDTATVLERLRLGPPASSPE
ncbi:MAG: DUF167 domain-containing protein [Candidatus Acidiferrales bacterium]